VSLDDYLVNLERFRADALARDIPVVFLTRPHKVSPVELSKNPSWRGSVPRYNAVLVDWAKRRDVPVVDVQQYFERLSPTLFSDECHFTREGYQRMGELVRDHLVNRRDGWEPQAWLTSRSSRKAGEAIARAARESSGAPRATR
jgi:lysophospholipase L1-like esterase